MKKCKALLFGFIFGLAAFLANGSLAFAQDSVNAVDDRSLGEVMLQAGGNAILGICVVFVVLVIICLIICLFGFIPKLQARVSKKEETVQVIEPTPQMSVAQTATEESDEELVAVITAAIAAATASTVKTQAPSGFVVRSIKRRI